MIEMFEFMAASIGGLNIMLMCFIIRHTGFDFSDKRTEWLLPLGIVLIACVVFLCVEQWLLALYKRDNQERRK